MSTPLTYCLCSHCAQIALFELGLCALSPQQFIQRAQRYKLSNEQQMVVDKLKLQVWNNEAREAI
jgi:hypothetical protein